jgi:hypothetical protein
MKLVAAALLAGLVLVLPLNASSSDGTRVVLAAHYVLTGPTTGEGTFSACCAVNDSGATTVSFTILRVEDGSAVFESTHTYTGALGSFADTCRGRMHPVSSPRQIAEGRCELVSGTGAYTRLAGNNRFVAVLDATTGTATGTHDGRARLGR